MGESVTVLGFEGPEKRLEIDFKRNPENPLGLRRYSKSQWQELLDEAKCTIISTNKNEYFDAYVLSESSLFVWPYKFMLKTCGTTTLLKVIPKLLEMAESSGLAVELVMYSRKNFLFPQVQIFPHGSWSDEQDYLDQFFDGSPYVLGPMTKDHWYLYLADYSDGTQSTKEKTLEIMMHNLDPSAAIKFYRKEGTEDQDKFPGVADLIPGQVTDEFNFTPCGYSMNGLRNEVYSTIHVTPEPHCSYASFETNWVLPCKSLINHVFSIFKPGTVTLAYFVEQSQDTNIDLEIPGYSLKYRSLSHLGNNRDITLCCYESKDFALRNSRRPRAAGIGRCSIAPPADIPQPVWVANSNQD
jgi:S-adenosylmethionine decarboxylase